MTARINGNLRKLISAYAPVSGTVASRVSCFRQLKGMTTAHTYMGIDANCTPDPAIDRQGAAPTATPSTVERALLDMTSTHNLIDAARRSLGDQPFFSSHHVVAGGRETRTRIDQIYTPDEGDVLYEHADCEDPFAHARHRIELDHIAIEVRSETQDDTPRGTDIKRIDESIFKNQQFNNKIAGMLTRCIEAAESDDEVNWISTWENIKEQAKKMMLAETKRTKYRQSKELNRKTKELKDLRADTNRGNGGPGAVPRADKLEEEIKRLSVPYCRASPKTNHSHAHHHTKFYICVCFVSLHFLS